MTHEEFLTQLTLGYAGITGYRVPSDTGDSEADAIVRWMARHISEFARLNFLDSLRVLSRRTWRYWDAHNAEDVDITLTGSRDGHRVTLSLKVKVGLSQHRRYRMTVKDWTSRSFMGWNGVLEIRPSRRLLVRDFNIRRERRQNGRSEVPV